MEEKINEHDISVGKPEGRRPLQSASQKNGWKGVGRFHLSLGKDKWQLL